MRYLSVCSGIEAASVAWKHLGWKAVALSEIEKFPCEVLKHHYPDVPNLGDMTLLTKNEYLNEQQIDLLVGGTPCQSFSVAGLRAGLDDERGNLAIEYIRLLEHKRPKWFLWENVPGVLSSNGGADFASILSGWTGRDIAPQSFGISGVIEGQFYSVAWRVLDSRHFGVPQRRRRVFVVGYIGSDWRPPVAVLFERESLRRDFTPSRKTRKATTTSTVAGTQGGDINCQPNGISGAMTRKWAKGTGGPAGDEHYNLIVQPAYGISANIVDRTEKSGCQRLGVIENESYTLTKSDKHCVMQPIVIDRAAFNQGVNAKYDAQIEHTETAPCLVKSGPHAVMTQPIILDDQGGNVMTVYDQGHVGTLRAQTHGHEPIVCLPINTMTVQGRPSDDGRMGSGIGQDGEPQNTITKGHSHAVFVAYPAICYFDDRRQGLEINNEISPTAIKHWGNSAHNIPFVQQSMVRRLTPLECCRLQGFPDDYMDGVPNASDSKWYAAFGNSMTVNVMKWIGERIDKVDKIKRSL